MRTIECKKLGSVSSLTVGKVYPIIEESGDRFTIVNDKGVQMRYGKNLFMDPVNVPDEPQMELDRPRRGRPRARREEPAVAPARVIPVVESIEVNTSVRNDNGNISFNARFSFINNFVFERSTNNIISSNGIASSCGVQALTGLDDLNREINRMRDAFTQYVNEHRQDFTLSQDIDLNELFNEIPVAFVQDLVASYQGDDADVKAGILLLSTTENSIRQHPAMRNALNNASAGTIEAHNPNSGNDIVMWNIPVEA